MFKKTIVLAFVSGVVAGMLHAADQSVTAATAPVAQPATAPAAAVAVPAQQATPAQTATPEDGPAVAKAEPVAEREVVTRLQIFLDQQNFGPGKIDGAWGEFTGKALAKYARKNGLAVDETIYDKLPLAELHPVYTTYTFKPEDMQWIGPVAYKPSEQAKLKKLLYSGLLEFVAERYHSDPDFLARLNAPMNMDLIKVGDTIRVPNVEPFKIEDVRSLGSLPAVPEFKARQVIVDRKERMATLLEGEQIVAAFPITPGSDRLPTPPGKWQVVGIASLPNFRWDEGVLNHGVRTEEFFMLPPGPNNPVGVAWIGLSKPGIGMHGTNSPNSIGRAHSHGCMRLANWDAVRLAHMVTKGITVEIQ